MENVYPDLAIPVNQDKGTIRQGAYCIDTLGHMADGTIGMFDSYRKTNHKVLLLNPFQFK